MPYHDPKLVADRCDEIHSFRDRQSFVTQTFPRSSTLQQMVFDQTPTQGGTTGSAGPAIELIEAGLIYAKSMYFQVQPFVEDLCQGYSRIQWDGKGPGESPGKTTTIRRLALGRHRHPHLKHLEWKLEDLSCQCSALLKL